MRRARGYARDVPAPDPHTADALVALRVVIDGNDPFPMIEFDDGRGLNDELVGERGHQALVTAEQLGWIAGEVSERASGSALWVEVRPTPEGMRAAGAWPRAGRESDPGPWDDDHWGRSARPCLERVASGDLDHVSLGMGASVDDQQTFLALWLLTLADLIDAQLQDRAALHGARLTPSGRRALAGPQTHLDRARIILAEEGNATQALIDLVEGEIADLVAVVADWEHVDMTDRNGDELVKLRQRIDRLATEEAIAKFDAAVLRAALEARHVVGHTPSADTDHSRDEVEWVIDGVERVRDRVLGH